MSQAAVLAAVYETLNPATTTGVVFKSAFGGTDSTRGRIYNEQAAMNVALPLAVFAITSESTQAYLGGSTSSVHTMVLELAMYFPVTSGITAAMASESLAYTLLHMADLPTSDTSIAKIRTVCAARGTADIADDALVIIASYSVTVSRKAP
jgi:hypothetical protein